MILVRPHVKKNLGKFEFYPDGPQRLFTFEDKNNEDYIINFNTGLGSLFANNMLALEWEWLPFEFYKLSKNAQNLYRKYILVKKKGSELRLTDIELAKMLKLQTTNRTARRKSIERLLAELVENGYIEYEIEKGYKDVVFLNSENYLQLKLKNIQFKLNISQFKLNFSILKLNI